MKRIFTFLALLISMSAFAQLEITNTTDYRTMDQLFLANEINESGEPFAESLGYDLDELDPMVPNMPDSIAYTLGIENYEYSRYQLGTIVSRSGMGLHMMWSPIIMARAAMQDSSFDGSITGKPNGYKEDDMIMMMIRGFGMRAHFMPFRHAWPQFAEFRSGDPHLPQPVAADFGSDFKTLRWDRSKMEKILNPGSMGQSMMKQYLWAQDMLSAFHDADENDVPVSEGNPDHADGTFDPTNNVFLGGDGADGFIGQVLTAEAINKSLFLINKLAFDKQNLGGVNPATYNPMNGIKYFPHEIAVEESMVIQGLPPRMSKLTVVDPDSYLWDQLSCLWGAESFTNMMDPSDTSDDAHKVYKYVFDGDPFPPAASISGMPGPYDLMKGTSKVLLQNIMAMHRNASNGTFVDKVKLSPSGSFEQGNTISAVNAGYLMMIFSEVANEFAGTPLMSAAMNGVRMQADFVLASMKDPAGGYYAKVDLNDGPVAGPKKAMVQAAIARGLYAAYDLTGDQKYLDGADAAYTYLMTFYQPDINAFVMKEGATTSTYGPFNLAIIAGGLRAATMTGGHKEAAMIYTRFFKKVINKMQLSEAGATGETGGDSDGDGIPFIPEQPDGLPPILAPQAVYDFTSAVTEVPELIQGVAINPNPVHDHAVISFSLKQKAEVQILVYTPSGQLVDQVMHKTLSAGQHQAVWSPTHNLSTGAYLYQLRLNGKTAKSGLVHFIND